MAKFFKRERRPAALQRELEAKSKKTTTELEKQLTVGMGLVFLHDQEENGAQER